MAAEASSQDLTDREYRSLAEFRYKLRSFLRFTDTNAIEAGLDARLYQALLALRGLPAGEEPTIGYLARSLLLEHHSAVAMVDRLEKKRVVRRRRGRKDRRKVFVELTPLGRQVLRRLAVASRRQLSSSSPTLMNALRTLGRETKT